MERITVIANNKGSEFVRESNVAATILARDWKGLQNWGGNCVVEVNQIGNILPTKSRENPNQGRVYDTGGLSPTITTMGGGNLQPFIVDEGMARVRRLTPRECWRLMDCTDEDFDKAASVISNSRLYACAGNAIIVNVLVAIMGQLFEGKEEVYRERG